MNTVEPDTATDDGTAVDDDGCAFAVQTRCSVDHAFELTEFSSGLKPVCAGFAATLNQLHAEHTNASAPTTTTSAR